jgi:hypothetical protein
MTMKTAILLRGILLNGSILSVVMVSVAAPEQEILGFDT